MKKKQSLVAVVAGTIISLGLIGCGLTDNNVKADDGKFSGGTQSTDNYILIDNETGCQYIQSSKVHGLSTTPQLDESGKPMCGKDK